MIDKCYVNIKGKWLEAIFIGVFQYSRIIEPSMVRGGHSGGIIAYPIAVVKIDGKIIDVKLSDITFNR